MRQFYLQKNTAKSAGKFPGKCMAIFYIFSSFFVMILNGTVCRDGKGGIPVKSRCKCGHPDRDFTENTRFCSAMSTKSEIGAKIGQMPLVTSSAAAEIEMKRRVEVFIPYFSSFLMIILKTMCVGMG